jgi:hypothetical protein
MAYGQINAEQLTTQSGFTLGAGNASSFKNRILNGSMVLDQRNAGASVTPAVNTITYTLDRWLQYQTAASKFSVQRNAGSVTPPSGFTNYLGITSLSSYSAISTDAFLSSQYIEGFNVADFAWGTASAASVTVSFWARSSLTGTFSLSVCNDASTRNYIATYTISSANTWEYKTVTIPGDTSGTWLTNNGIGLQLRFDLGSGSNFNGTAGSWGTSNVLRTSGSQSVVGTNGATLYITGVQLEVGTVATSFDYRSYGTELLLCQRYFEAIALNSYSGTGQAYSTSGGEVPIYFTVKKRADPTITLPATGSAGGQISFTTSSAGIPATIGSNTTAAISTNKFNIQGSGYTAAFTAGNALFVYSSGNSTIQVSAEL